MSNIPVLYSYWRSSCSWRVRIALNLKKIKHEIHPVSLLGNEQYLNEVAPFALIPVWVDNGFKVSESLAIIEYLEEKYPNTLKLLPGSLEDRAQIRALALQFIANIQPLQNKKVLLFYSNDQEKRNEWAQHWISTMFEKIETALKKTSRKYAYGDQITLVDVCIPPQLNNAKRFGVDLTPYPTLMRLGETLSQIPEFAEADCFNQLDTPESEKKNKN